MIKLLGLGLVVREHLLRQHGYGDDGNAKDFDVVMILPMHNVREGQD